MNTPQNMDKSLSETAEKFSRNDVYQIVTDRVIELLEAGTVPWHKPWASTDEMPKNLVSGKDYRGINVWLLSCAGFSSPYWVSYKQAQELGGNVRKGEKSSIAVFWKQLDVQDKDNPEKTKRVPLLRYYRVFNVEQCDGIEYQKPQPRNPNFNPIAQAQQIVSDNASRGPEIVFEGGRACYSRREDKIRMPAPEMFEVEAEFYSTLFHELTHATGHESRLARLQNDNSNFGSSMYAKEELIAEMGASFLSATAGILHRTVDNSAAYIASWLERLRDDRKLVVQAASAAHKAADYILGKTYQTDTTETGQRNPLALAESEVS